MTPFLLIIALGLVNWFGTLLIVESEFFAGLRGWIRYHDFGSKRKFAVWFWDKLNFMINCHMCAGTWVAFMLVPFAPPLFGIGFLNFMALSLLIKAIGHLTLVIHKLGDATTDRLKRE